MTDPRLCSVERGLLALVACNGRCRKAEALLHSQGVTQVTAMMLYEWKQEHAVRFEELRKERGPELEERLTAGLRDTSMLASEAMQEAVERARQRLEEGEDQDPAKTAANLATVADKSARNMLALSGRPTHITENRNVDQLLHGLNALVPGLLPGYEEEAKQLEAEVADGGVSVDA